MMKKQLLLAVICLLVMPIAIGCTDNTSSNSTEEQIQAEIREDLDEQQREREERIEECQRSRTPSNATQEEREQIARDCVIDTF